MIPPETFNLCVHKSFDYLTRKPLQAGLLQNGAILYQNSCRTVLRQEARADEALIVLHGLGPDKCQSSTASA